MYGPPDSDSDEADYDGFSFGDDIDEVSSITIQITTISQI